MLVDSCSYKVSINVTSTTETPMDVEGAISRAELKQVLKNHPLKKTVKDTDSAAWRNSHAKKQVERPPLINQDIVSMQTFIKKVGKYKSCYDGSRGAETSCTCNKRLLDDPPTIAKTLLDCGIQSKIERELILKAMISHQDNMKKLRKLSRDYCRSRRVALPKDENPTAIYCLLTTDSQVINICVNTMKNLKIQ